MTDPTPTPQTPTRDEAVLDHERIPTWPPLKKALWDVVTGEKLNDGHYINAYQLTDKLYAAAVDRVNRATDAEIGGIHRSLASAPAPASGGVDAVARRAKYLLNRLETDDGLGIGEIDTMLRMAASLSPAATPVSGAEPVAWARMTGDEVTHLLTEKRAGYKPLYLAKPASSPAPVRPIGNQGISDYQREIARNMAEGFAAWDAARQEALPSDEPASSPAGGEVRRVRHKKRGTTYRVLHGAVMQSTHWRDTHYKVPADGRTVVVYQSEDDGSVWVRPAEEFEDGRFEALSQSASAGRVGE